MKKKKEMQVHNLTSLMIILKLHPLTNTLHQKLQCKLSFGFAKFLVLQNVVTSPFYSKEIQRRKRKTIDIIVNSV